MKYFFAFFGLIAAIGILTLMVNFTSKGVPETLEISDKSITQYAAKNTCSGPNDILEEQYDFDVEIVESTDPDYEILSSKKEGINVVIQKVPEDSEGYLPVISPSSVVIRRTPEGQTYQGVMLGKVKKCFNIPDFSDSFSDKEVNSLIEGDAFFDDSNLRRNTFSNMFDSKNIKIHSAKYIIKGRRVNANGRAFIGNVSEYKTSEGSFYFYGSMTLKNRTLIFHMMAGKGGDDHKKILDFMARSVFFD